MHLAFFCELSRLGPEDRRRLLDRRPADEPQLREQVRAILAGVRREGDVALRSLARRYDGVVLEELEVPRKEWVRALDRLDPLLRGDLETAAANLEIFHRAQLPQDFEIEVGHGVRLGRKVLPLSRVGVYAPGGRAAYPSSVLMGLIPGRAAGVGELLVCSPPGPDGLPPQTVLAACAIGEANRLFAVGGAGAIAALVYGTETIPRVDAIVGPGNRYVNEAKRQVAGELIIDSPAGPSEVLVVADDEADPRLCALELVCQAEHDPDAAVALVTPSPTLWEKAASALEEEVSRTPRRAVVRQALSRQGALLLADSLEDALIFAREYAPEHLALYTRNPKSDMEKVPTAGTVFLGQASAVAFGDYLTGANHVLPTGGTARSFSSLSTLHFLRHYTWQEVSPRGAEELAPAVERLALAEGLPAHAEAARARRAS